MAETVLLIEGMTCGGCVQSVQGVLMAVAGVQSVVVDLASGRAVVQGGTVAALVAAVEAAGFDVRVV